MIFEVIISFWSSQTWTKRLETLRLPSAQASARRPEAQHENWGACLQARGTKCSQVRSQLKTKNLSKNHDEVIHLIIPSCPFNYSWRTKWLHVCLLESGLLLHRTQNPPPQELQRAKPESKTSLIATTVLTLCWWRAARSATWRDRLSWLEEAGPVAAEEEEEPAPEMKIPAPHHPKSCPASGRWPPPSCRRRRTKRIRGAPLARPASDTHLQGGGWFFSNCSRARRCWAAV